MMHNTGIFLPLSTPLHSGVDKGHYRANCQTRTKLRGLLHIQLRMKNLPGDTCQHDWNGHFLSILNNHIIHGIFCADVSTF